jgi:hypothetical protein
MKHLLLAGLVCACTLAQPKPGTGSIDGHVVDSVTGAVVRKASVSLVASQLQVRMSADTDAQGRFQFTALTMANTRDRFLRTGSPRNARDG